MTFCRLLGGYPLREIGTAFGDVSYTGAASAVARVCKRPRQDARLQQTLLQLKQTLQDKKD